MKTRSKKFLKFLASSGFCLLMTGAVGCAQTYYYPTDPNVPVYQYYPPGPPVAVAQPQAPASLTPDQLDQLLAPIALYPDPLLAQLFPATTYPQDLLAAASWLQQNPTPTEPQVQALPYDASIKALLHYPTVIQMLSQQPDWMQTIGAAFINQQQDVMDSIQRLRAEAQASGALVSNPQQQVVGDSGDLQILPAQPDVIYVPTYDPNIVYTPEPAGYWANNPGLYFGIGFGIGDWLGGDFDWRHHDIDDHFDWRSHVNDHRPIVIEQDHPWHRDDDRPRPVYVQQGLRPDYNRLPDNRPPDVRKPDDRGYQGRPDDHADQGHANDRGYVPPAGRPADHPIAPARPEDVQREDQRRAADAHPAPAPAPAPAPQPKEIRPAFRTPAPAPAPAPAPRPAPAPAARPAPEPRPAPAPPSPPPAAFHGGANDGAASDRGHASMHR
jgi:hypothetical protein